MTDNGSHSPDDVRIQNIMNNFIGTTRKVKEVKSNLRTQTKSIQAGIDDDKRVLINFMLRANKSYLRDSAPYIVLRKKMKKGGWNDDRIRAYVGKLLTDLQENKNNGTSAVDYGADMFKRWRDQYSTVYADIEESPKRPKFRTCDDLRNQLIEQGDFIP